MEKERIPALFGSNVFGEDAMRRYLPAEAVAAWKACLDNGEPLSLTAQEFELLQALMRSPDTPVSRQELLRTAWGYQSIGITRTVDVHVQRLRRKLGAKAIETVYKTGYRLRLA